jgi:hypothetical protein
MGCHSETKKKVAPSSVFVSGMGDIDFVIAKNLIFAQSGQSPT